MVKTMNKSPSDTATKKEGPRDLQVVGIRETINATSSPNFLLGPSPMLNATRLTNMPIIAGINTKIVTKLLPEIHERDAMT